MIRLPENSAPIDVLIDSASNDRIQVLPASTNAAACRVCRKKRPRPVAALRPRQRPTVVGVDQSDVRTGETVGGKASQQADGVVTEIGDAEVGTGAAEQKRPADSRISGRNTTGSPHRNHVMRAHAAEVGSRVASDDGGVFRCAKSAPDEFSSRARPSRHLPG
jgi:hypothetical protein